MKLALHSISYAGLWRGQVKLDLFGFLKKAAALGFPAVEIMAKRPHASVLDLDPNQLREISHLMTDLNVKCACIAGYSDFTLGFTTTMLPIDEIQIAYITQLIRMANALDCDLVRIFTGFEVPGVDFNNQWDRCIHQVRECCQRAADYGVKIGVQNHHDIAVDAASLNQFITEVNEPNCVAMFDAWAPALQQSNFQRDIEMLGAKIAYTTVADYQLRPRFHYNNAIVNYEADTPRTIAVPMGEGIIDYKEFFSHLQKSGFNGYVAYEMCSELRDGGDEPTLDAYANRFLEYMKKV